MLRVLSLVFVLAFLAPTAARAQQADPDAAQRTDMAQRLMNASQGDYLNNLNKLIEQAVLDAMGDMEALPADQAAWMRRNVPAMGVRLAQDMIPALVALYAQTFTLAELEAQLALYEGPLGRSIANKTMQLGAAQDQIIMQAQIRYLDDLMSKFCAEFECAAGPVAAKPARR